MNNKMKQKRDNNAKANAEATINKTIYEIYELTEEEIGIIEGEFSKTESLKNIK